MADGTTAAGNVSDIVATETDGTTPVNMSPASTDYDTDHKYNKTVKLTYTDSTSGETGTVNYTFDIINDLKSISVHTTPKAAYNVGETLDVTGGEIKVTRATGNDEILSMTPSMVSGFNSSAEHPMASPLSLTVSYTENGVTETTSYDVTVIDTVTSVTVQNPPTEAKYGEPLDLSGTTIDIVKGSGNSSIPVTESMISGYNPNPTNLPDTQTVTISYGGETDTFTVVVKDYVTGITVTPNTVAGSLNDTLASLISSNSIEYTVNYAKAGAVTPVALTEAMVSGYSATATTPQSLTVTYTDNDTDSFSNGDSFNDTLNVTLSNTVSAVAITAPTKTTYNHGDSLDLSTAVVDLTYADGTTGNGNVSDIVATELDGTTPVDMSPADTDYDTDHKYSKTIKLTYTDTLSGTTNTVNYTFDIINDIKSIAMHQAPKDAYNVNDSLDVTDGEIKITRAVGNDEILPMTPSMVTGFDSSTEYPVASPLSLTVSYTENGITQTTSYDVTVVDTVTSIDIQNPPTEAKYGEPLDLSGTTIDIVKGSGNTSIPVTESMISGYDPDALGPQTVTVTYGGQTDTFVVEVKDYVTGITLVPPTNTDYNWSSTATLDLTGATVEAIMASGAATSPVALTDPEVTVDSSAFNPTSVGTQTINVTYKGFTESFDVNIKDEVYGITVNDPPSSVNYGDPLTGLTITVNRDSDPAAVIPVTSDMISGYDPTDVSGTQTVTVTYEGKTDTFTINVVDYTVGIVLTSPSKDEYNYGESLDLSDGYITIQTASGDNTQTINLDSSMISGYDPTVLGPQTVTVSYDGFTATFPVTVNDPVLSIAMENLPKQNYNYGESLDVTGGSILVTRGSGITSEPLTESMVSGYDPNTIGVQTLTVTFGGQTTSYDVTVNDFIDRIEIDNPTKLAYKLNEPMDLTGGQVNVITASGAVSATVAMDASMISGFDTSTTGAKSITVTYAGKTATFGITVSDPLAAMSIENLPKVDYLFGEGMDLTGGSISVTRESGAIESIPMDPSMITGFNTNTVGQVQVFVNYEGAQDSFLINVTDYESGATLVAPNKKNYEYGQELDLSGGLMRIMMASGAVKEEAALTASMISGYNPTVVGTQTITVTYKGYTKQFNVSVTDTIAGISLYTAPNKTNYNYGENLDVTGGKLKVVKTSGTTFVDITPDMVSGFNPTVAGYQVLTITYSGFTAQYTVYVNKEEKQETPETPSTTPNAGTTVINNTTIIQSTPSAKTNNNTARRTKTTVATPKEVTEEKEEEPKQEEPVIETPVEEPVVEQPTEEAPKKEEKKEEEKPTITLGEKDTEGNAEQKSNKKLPWIILMIALLFLLLLLISRKNTKIFVEEDGEFVLGGKEKLDKNNPEIDVNEYLDGETYENKVKIVLNDNISDVLDGKEITIKHRDQVIKVKVKYEDKPFEIILQ